jgi:hypothetical protein
MVPNGARRSGLVASATVALKAKRHDGSLRCSIANEGRGINHETCHGRHWCSSGYVGHRVGL